MKKQTNLTIKNGDETETIPCYFQLEQCVRRNGRTSWTARKTFKGKRKEFTSDAIDQRSAWRDLNQQCHDFISGKKRDEVKRSTSPTLTEIAHAYLGASKSQIPANQDSRKTSLGALKSVTEGLASGSDPVFEKQKNGIVKLVSGGFWDNLRVDKLSKKVARDFLDGRILGYVDNTDEWHERARGANDRLRQARSVFSEKARNELYNELFTLPDLEDSETGFLKAPYLPARKKRYKAPKKAVVDQILSKIGQLETEDPDVYACFLLEYGCGLSWGEVMHARYSWLDEAEENIVGDSTTQYVITVQPDRNWVPKTENRCRTANVPDEIFQSLVDLQHAPRPSNNKAEDPKVQVSAEELARLVWSKPAASVAEELGVTTTTVANYCNRLGVRKPENGFWTKVRLGQAEHPKGAVPADAIGEPQIAAKASKPTDDYILQRHRCNGKTAANRRLARWFRDNIDGWDRRQVGHELRKLNISMVIRSTGSVYQGSKHAGHSDIRVTQECYGDILEKQKVQIPMPKKFQ